MQNEVLHDYEVFASFWYFRRKMVEDLLRTVDRNYIREKEEYDLTEMVLKRCTRDPEDKGFCIGSECTLGMFVRALLLHCDAYPLIRENNQYQTIRAELRETNVQEKELAKRYNASVERYNQKLESIPSGFVASVFHFKAYYTYAYDEEADDQIQAVF